MDTPPAEAPKPDPKTEPKRILVVEDDDSLASVYVSRLKTEGYQAERVADGEDALTSAIRFKPDLILLDIMMPKISGFDVLDILRNTPETSKAKIVILTARGQDSDRSRAMALGVDDYLVKSQVEIADVMAKIKKHLA
ncbi:MAG: response regulator [Candidatus Saccharimonadales bacterium]